MQVAIDFDLPSLMVEFREFSVDSYVAALTNGDAVSFGFMTALGSPKILSFQFSSTISS